MARKKDSPQKAALRDMMSVILEGTLDEELDEELGYTKYDYLNKKTELDIPRDRKGEFEPQVIKKYQNTITQDMEEKIISMYAKCLS